MALNRIWQTLQNPYYFYKLMMYAHNVLLFKIAQLNIRDMNSESLTTYILSYFIIQKDNLPVV